jgi:DNA-binding MarR family transcriptional regulator
MEGQLSRRPAKTRRPSQRQRLVAELARAVRAAGRQTVFFHEAVADRLGLSPVDSRVLSYLQETGPVPAGHLAELTGLTSGAVTGMIDRLEAAGLVRRDSDPEDRRKVMVAAVDDSPRALAAERLFAPLAKEFAMLTASYTNAQLEILVEFVNRATAMLRDQSGQVRQDY